METAILFLFSSDKYHNDAKKKAKYKKRQKIFKLNNESNKNMIPDDAKQIKIRDPSIEIIRILAMFAIITNHIVAHNYLDLKYKKYKNQMNFILIICSWHVCGFALISGIVGYKSFKYSNLIYLWILVTFYSVAIYIYFKIFKLNTNKDSLISEFFPVIFCKYWYFTQYFGMYLFLPAINKSVENLTKSELKILSLSLIGLFIIWNDLINPKKDTFKLNRGYSVLSLLIFYIFGTYIGKYKNEYFGFNKIWICSFCIFTFICSSLLTHKLSIYDLNELTGLKLMIMKSLKQLFTIKINSFPMMLQAISLIFFFMQIEYNKYITKIINFIGPLTFSVYLIHENILIMNNYVSLIFRRISNHLALSSIIKILLFKVIKIYCISLTIDYFRSLLFKFCYIKKICLIIEKYLLKLLG